MYSPGEVIGSYKVESLLGEGATAAVYRASDPKLRRIVAVKVLREGLPPSSRERFQREISTLVGIRHAGIVRIYDSGEDQGRPYYVMENLEGRPLDGVIEALRVGRRKLRPDQALSLARQLTDALAGLHALKLIHRDLKPSNIMIVAPLRAVLIDFGLVGQGEKGKLGDKTRALGTMSYMSPEQLEGGLLDERSDVFQLGLILHEMVSGQAVCQSKVPPWFEGRTWSPPRLTLDDESVPADLERAILKCMVLSTADRCQSMAELKEMLRTPALLQLLYDDGRLPPRKAGDDPLMLGSQSTSGTKGHPASPTVSVDLEKYELEGLIASGGMGEIYQARHKGLGRSVAIKVMRKELCHDQALVRRFQRELEALAKLQHPRIVPVYDVDMAGPTPYYVMELVAAPPLSKVLAQRGPLPLQEAIVLFADLIEALTACHERGLLHRDVKPDNLLVEEDGHAKLTDFGLVKISDRTALTMDDEMLGTPSYMAPEMVEGTLVDMRSDYYQSGLVLFEMLTGRRALTGKTLEEIWELVLKKVPEPVHLLNPEVPVSASNFVANLLEKKPSNRYQTVIEIRTDLAALRVGEDVPRRGRRGSTTKPFPSLGVSGAIPLPPGVKAKSETRIEAVVPGQAAVPAPVRAAPPVRSGSRTTKVEARPSRPFGPRDEGEPGEITVREITPAPTTSAPSVLVLARVGGAVAVILLGLMTGKLVIGGLGVLGLVIEGALWARVHLTAAAGTNLRESVRIKNGLNVAIRVDYVGAKLGSGTHIIEPNSDAVLDLEVGASLTLRKDGQKATLKRDVVCAGKVIVLG